MKAAANVTFCRARLLAWYQLPLPWQASDGVCGLSERFTEMIWRVTGLHLRSAILIYLSRFRFSFGFCYPLFVVFFFYHFYVYKVLVGKPEGKSPLGRPSHRWENNNKMILKIGWGYGFDSFSSAQRQEAGSCEHGNELSNSMKCWEFLECLSSCWLSRRTWPQGHS
jgi:hypothetical protein